MCPVGVSLLVRLGVEIGRGESWEVFDELEEGRTRWKPDAQ